MIKNRNGINNGFSLQPRVIINIIQERIINHTPRPKSPAMIGEVTVPKNTNMHPRIVINISRCFYLSSIRNGSNTINIANVGKI